MYQFKAKIIEKYSYPVCVTGVTRSSRIRRKVRLIDYYRVDKRINVNPVIGWKKGQILEYIKQHGIEVNVCYNLYGHSGNCMFCPYHNRKQIILTMQDQYWRKKILNALVHAKGKISKEIARRWIRYSSQSILIQY